MDKILKTFKGTDCEKMVKLRGTELSITGVKAGIDSINVEVGAFSNKNVEFFKVNEVLVAMDSSQYMLCNAIEKMPEDDPFRRECMRMRLQTIIGFNQLQALLAMKDDDRFKDEIETWIQYMNDLSKYQISSMMVSNPGTGPGYISGSDISGSTISSQPSPSTGHGHLGPSVPGGHPGLHDTGLTHHDASPSRPVSLPNIPGLTLQKKDKTELKRIAKYQNLDEKALDKALDKFA